jgi:hypothetical protein
MAGGRKASSFNAENLFLKLRERFGLVELVESGGYFSTHSCGEFDTSTLKFPVLGSAHFGVIARHGACALESDGTKAELT